MSSSSVQSAFEFFEKLVSDFSWKRLLLVFAMVALAILAFVYYQQSSRSIVINRIGNEIELLERLSSLYDDPAIRADVHLESSYNSLKVRLAGLSGSSANEPVGVGYLAMFAIFAAPWIVLTAIMFLVSDSRDGFGKVVGGVCILAIPSSLFGPLLPLFEPRWISYLAIPILVCLVLVLIVMRLFSKK